MRILLVVMVLLAGGRAGALEAGDFAIYRYAGDAGEVEVTFLVERVGDGWMTVEVSTSHGDRQLVDVRGAIPPPAWDPFPRDPGWREGAPRAAVVDGRRLECRDGVAHVGDQELVRLSCPGLPWPEPLVRMKARDGHVVAERRLLELGSGGLHQVTCPAGTQPVRQSEEDLVTEYCLEPDGQRHGPYEERDHLGHVQQRGQYEHGKEAGAWTTPMPECEDDRRRLRLAAGLADIVEQGHGSLLIAAGWDLWHRRPTCVAPTDSPRRRRSLSAMGEVVYPGITETQPLTRLGLAAFSAPGDTDLFAFHASLAAIVTPELGFGASAGVDVGRVRLELRYDRLSSELAGWGFNASVVVF